MFEASLLVLFLTCLLAGIAMRRRSTAKRYPPGPKGLPIIGNLFDEPKDEDWKAFIAWSEQYGE